MTGTVEKSINTLNGMGKDTFQTLFYIIRMFLFWGRFREMIVAENKIYFPVHLSEMFVLPLYRQCHNVCIQEQSS